MQICLVLLTEPYFLLATYYMWSSCIITTEGTCTSASAVSKVHRTNCNVLLPSIAMFLSLNSGIITVIKGAMSLAQLWCTYCNRCTKMNTTTCTLKCKWGTIALNIFECLESFPGSARKWCMPPILLMQLEKDIKETLELPTGLEVAIATRFP